MKKSYKTKTGIFGSDAERYVSRLFGLGINPNGSQRPDLISTNGHFNPKLSIEVKSGRAKKGVLVDYQLRYAISSEEDYAAAFGGTAPFQQEMLFGREVLYPQLSNEPVAYYYDVVDRVDGIMSDELKKPFSAILLKWGDQFIVPHEWGFWAFAVGYARRTGRNIGEVADELRETMKADVDGTNTENYYWRKKDSNSWQDLHGRDVLAFYEKDEGLATEDGRKRLEMMRTAYPEMDELKRVKIEGPNNSTIYVLAKAKHRNLFNDSLRKKVEEKRPILERVGQERSMAQSLLSKINFVGEEGLFGNGDFVDHRLGIGLTKGQVTLLKRLCSWRGKPESDKDEGEDEVPF